MLDALIELEERGWQALSSADVGFCEERLDEGAVLVVPGMVTAHRESEPEYVALVTSVYAKRSAGWQLVYHQQTPTPT